MEEWASNSNFDSLKLVTLGPVYNMSLPGSWRLGTIIEQGNGRGRSPVYIQSAGKLVPQQGSNKSPGIPPLALGFCSFSVVSA